MCECQPKSTTEDQRPSLAEVAREVTDNGRIIYEFLSDMVQGKMEGATFWHRLEAARQLRAFGVEIPQAVIDAAAKATKASKPRKQPTAPKRPASSRQNNEIADIVKAETENGKDVVRFLMDVMQGKLEGFKPYHRLMAAKELLKLALGIVPGLSSADDGEDNPYNHEDDPFDFDNYDEEQFIRDRDGERALRHIYGSEEAITIVREAVARFKKWVPLLEENYVPERDFTPIDDPEDDPEGKGCYGYNALRFVFGDNRSIRVASRVFERFKKIEDNSFKCSNHDHPDWARQHAVDVIRKSFKAEDRTMSEQHQPQQNPAPPPSATPEPPNVILSEAEGPPSHDHAHPSTKHNPDRPNVILERSEEPPAPAQSPSPTTPDQPNDHPVPPNVILNEAEGPPSRGTAPPSNERHSDHPVGEGFKPSHDHAHPSTESGEEPPAPPESPASVTAGPTEKPPERPRRKKITRKIHLGPPDEEDPPDDYPRRRGDPDEIRIPLRNLLRITYGPL